MTVNGVLLLYLHDMNDDKHLCGGFRLNITNDLINSDVIIETKIDEECFYTFNSDILNDIAEELKDQFEKEFEIVKCANNDIAALGFYTSISDIHAYDTLKSLEENLNEIKLNLDAHFYIYHDIEDFTGPSFWLKLDYIIEPMQFLEFVNQCGK